MLLSALGCLILSAALPTLILALLLCSPRAQSELTFLHRINWPPLDFERPSEAQVIHRLPWLSSQLGLFVGIEDTSAHWLHGNAGRLGLWLTRPTAACEYSRPLWMLYLHGNGENRGWAPAVRRVRRLSGPPYCCAVVQLDYRGYGDSDGEPTVEGLVNDSLIAWKWIREQDHALPVVYGHSLGSHIAIGLASKLQECEARAENWTAEKMEGSGADPEGCTADAATDPPQKLILEGAFASVADMAGQILGRALPLSSERLEEILSFPMPSNRLAQGLHTQTELLQIHGTRDGIVPIGSGRALFKHLPAATRFVAAEGAGHEGDALEDAGVQWELQNFLRPDSTGVA
jgi:pimeloyl-ACP methyl ester carboxylesterase